MPIPLIAGNWKMNMDASSAELLLKELKNGFGAGKGVDMAVFPPAVYLADAVRILKNSGIAVGAQNMCWEPEGAFTGEISSVMIRDTGAVMVILGHSERRHIFGEDDAMINRKLHHALQQDITPVLCIGETLDQREAGETEAVIHRQIAGGLTDVSPADIQKTIIAYEPVWAIGTGKTAAPEQAQAIHRIIREWLGSAYDRVTAGDIRILYGGSVKPQNAVQLLSQPDINGALVGGASLNSDSFLAIADAVS